MRQGEKIAIGLGVAAIGLGWYWSRQQQQTLVRLAARPASPSTAYAGARPPNLSSVSGLPAFNQWLSLWSNLFSSRAAASATNALNDPNNYDANGNFVGPGAYDANGNWVDVNGVGWAGPGAVGVPEFSADPLTGQPLIPALASVDPSALPGYVPVDQVV